MRRYGACLGVLVVLVAGMAAAVEQGTVQVQEAQEELVNREAMLRAARTGLCRVRYYFRRPEDEVGDERMPWDIVANEPGTQYESFIRQQMSMMTVGLLLDGTGQVLVRDMHFEQKYLDRIEVVGPDGAVYPARRDRLLDRVPAEILKLAESPADWEPPAYVRQEKIADPKSAFAVTLDQSGKQLWLAVHPVVSLYAYGGAGSDAGRYVVGPSRTEGSSMTGSASGYAALMESMMGGGMRGPAPGVGLLCNKQGQPIGAVVAGWPLDPDQEVMDWQHERLLSGPALSLADLDTVAERCRNGPGEAIYECKILYRQEGTGIGPAGLMDMLPSSLAGMMGEGDDTEWTTYGLAVSPRRLLVPHVIGRDQAARIEKILITVGDEESEAAFAGAYREVGAFLVDLKEGRLPAVASLGERQRPEKMRLFLTVEPRRKFGGKDLRVRPNRWFREHRGYRDGYYVSAVHRLPEGSWILDRDLNYVGLNAHQRVEGEELHAFAQGMGAFMLGDYIGGNERIFWSAELKPFLEDPVAHFDRHIRHKTEEEAKRIAWVGVEFSPVTPELAKQLDIEKATKDGKIGLYVNRVYTGSPAEKLGIANGDVLLRIKTDKVPHPIDLNPAQNPFDFFDWDWTDYMDYEYVEEYGGTEARWPSRVNYLTMLLKAIGEGEKVALTYLRGSEEKTETVTIEQAPRDFLSASKYKNKEVGFTVKDLTYEVRAALRLAPDEPGVVVARVESGSPAEIARVRPFELITAIDSVPVASADEFKERIEDALASQTPSLRLTVEYLGKSRFADLDLSQLGATESE